MLGLMQRGNALLGMPPVGNKVNGNDVIATVDALLNNCERAQKLQKKSDSVIADLKSSIQQSEIEMLR